MSRKKVEVFSKAGKNESVTEIAYCDLWKLMEYIDEKWNRSELMELMEQME